MGITDWPERGFGSRVVAAPRSGFSVVEVIIALAIIGILAGIGATRLGSPGPRVYANDLRALIQQARFEAIKLNLPVAVVWIDDESAFAAVRGSDAMNPCSAEIVMREASSRSYRRLTVLPLVEDSAAGTVSDVELSDGLVWLPSGQARACDFGPFPEVIATVSDGRTSLTVTVELTGRVTVE